MTKRKQEKKKANVGRLVLCCFTRDFKMIYAPLAAAVWEQSQEFIQILIRQIKDNTVRAAVFGQKHEDGTRWSSVMKAAPC